MSLFTRKLGWLAAIALCSSLLTGRTLCAQGVEQAVESAEHEVEKVESSDPNPLAFRTDLALWTLFIFLILFGFLSYFAWPQIAAALDERERKITDNIAASEARLVDAQRVLAEHEAKLAATAGEVRELLDEARRDADHTRKKIEAAGHQAAQDELARALREIERAKDGAIQELAVASANVAVDLAGKLIRTQITAEQNNELIHDAMTKLAAAQLKS
jgi:F-type H+-transporting ATPase subunit b